MLAIRTGLEQIEVGEDEMRGWLKAAQRVARHYSVKTTQTALDWIAFTGSTATVFGTRAVSVVVELNKRQATSGRRPPPARGAPGNVRPFPGTAPTAAPGGLAAMPDGPITLGDAPDGDGF